MPQATNLTVKNAAGTDKTFTLIAPASGDGGQAQWALKEGTISSVFPAVTAEAHRTGNSSRKLTVRVKLPASYTETVTGLTRVQNNALAVLAVSVPDDFPEALRDDFVAYTTNAFATALLKSMIRDAYPAT